MYLWLHQTSSTLAGPLQPLRSSRAQGLAPALPGQLPPQQVATEELWAGGEHCSSFRFQGNKTFTELPKGASLSNGSVGHGPQDKEPKIHLQEMPEGSKNFSLC